MQGTRKNKNQYQTNIATYLQRIKKSESQIVKQRLKVKIIQFKTQIRRIEIRENLIKRICDTIYDFFDLDVTIRELLVMKLGDGTNQSKKQDGYKSYLLKIRCLFFKLCHMNGIDGFDLYSYFRITGSKKGFYCKKYKGILRVKDLYLNDWLEFRGKIKLSYL